MFATSHSLLAPFPITGKEQVPILDALNRNSGAINLLFSCVVAGATVFYAILTLRLVAETRRMREIQTEPTISVWLEPSEHGINFLNIVIANVGQGAARDVTLTARPDFRRDQDKRISDLGMFKYGIKHLAPGQRIVQFLTSILDAVHGAGGDLSRLNFVVEATYEGGTGQTFSDSFPLHFESLEGHGTIGEPPLISIARSLSKVETQVGHIASGFSKIQVVVHTRRDIREDHERMLERIHESQAPPPGIDGSDNSNDESQVPSDESTDIRGDPDQSE